MKTHIRPLKEMIPVDADPDRPIRPKCFDATGTQIEPEKAIVPTY